MNQNDSNSEFDQQVGRGDLDQEGDEIDEEEEDGRDDGEREDNGVNEEAEDEGDEEILNRRQLPIPGLIMYDIHQQLLLISPFNTHSICS